MLNVGIIYQQGDMPASTGVEFNSNRGWFASFWKWTTPTNWQNFSAFRQPYLTARPPKGRLRKLSTSSIVPLFEIGVLCLACEKVAERMREDAAVLAATVHC